MASFQSHRISELLLRTLNNTCPSHSSNELLLRAHTWAHKFMVMVNTCTRNLKPERSLNIPTLVSKWKWLSTSFVSEIHKRPEKSSCLHWKFIARKNSEPPGHFRLVWTIRIKDSLQNPARWSGLTIFCINYPAFHHDFPTDF